MIRFKSPTITRIGMFSLSVALLLGVTLFSTWRSASDKSAEALGLCLQPDTRSGRWAIKFCEGKILYQRSDGLDYRVAKPFSASSAKWTGWRFFNKQFELVDHFQFLPFAPV